MKITMTKFQSLFAPRGGGNYLSASLCALLVGIMTSFSVQGQITLPTPRQIPFYEDFGTTITGASLTNASILVARGYTSGTPPIAPFQTSKSGAEATLDNAYSVRVLGTGLVAPLSNTTGTGSSTRSNGSNPASFVNVADAGLLLSLNNRSWAVVSGIKTVGFQSVKLSYTLELTERATNNATPNLDLVVFAQYKLSASDTWKNIVGSDWSTTGLNINTIHTFTGLSLPAEVENRNEVYIRFVHYQTADVTSNDKLSYAIDNISVSGNTFTLSNLDLSAPSAPAEGVPFDVLVKATNANGTVGTVTGNTVVTLSGVGTSGVLAGNLSTTILSGMSSATFSGLTYSQASLVTLTGSVISGNALASDMGEVQVAALPTKYKIEKVVPQTGTIFFANQPISVVVSSYNTLDLLSPVPTTSIFTLTGLDLAGITTGTITSGMNQTTVTGVLIPSTATGYTISVSTISGSILASATSTGFDIKRYPSILTISSVTGIAKKSPFFVVISTKNVDGEMYNLNTALGLTLSIASGTGTLNTTNATIAAGISSVTITGLTYDKTENGVSISVTGAGFVGAVSNLFSVSGPPVPTETYTIPQPQPLPYFQDFGTNLAVWSDVNNPSESILPFGLVVARQTSTVFRTFDDADLSNYAATGFVGGASVNPATYSGGNVGLRIETRETRGEALVLALRTNGFENLKFSYTLVPEVITGAGVYGMVAQSRVGSSGFFTNLAGTEFSSTASGVVLGSPINYNVTLPSALSGQSVINIRWIRWHNSVSNSAILDNISITGTKTDYLSIAMASGKKFTNDAQNIVISAFDKLGAPRTVTSATVVTITGNTSLLGITSTTILSGMSSATVAGLQFATSKLLASLSANVVSGDAFGSATSNSFTVYGTPTAFKVVNYQPLGNAQVGKAITLKAEMIDASGKITFSKTAIAATVSVVGGTGLLLGTTTGTFSALTDSVITIKSFTYSKAEAGIKFAINGGGLLQGLSDTLSVKADAFAGVRVLYKEDFEKTNKTVLAPNGILPAIPSDMRMFNIDGQTAVTATYPRYKNDAWVIQRVPQEGFLGRGGDVQPTPTYWSNVNSVLPDSNYIAYATSWFNDNTKAADRWLVTPGISMVGGNFKLNYQAKSSTSSGNFKDRLEVRVSSSFNGTIVADEWDALPVVNLATGFDSLSHLVSTRVINFQYNFVDNLVKNQVIYLAFRLVTPADKGDRISIDNIYVTSGGATSVTEVEKLAQIGIKATPNPAKETITIQSAVTESVKIYNLIGNQVLSGTTNTSIAIGSLTKGMYVAITTKGTVKFIVE